MVKNKKKYINIFLFSASVIGFALITGNIIITPLMGLLGRKKSHLLTIVPVLTGWFLLLVVKSVAGLIIARFIQGIAMGMLGPLGSIIIGEMTDPVNRGAFLTGVSLSLTIGVMFCHALGSFFTWRHCALICSFITFTSLCLIIYTPESPSWLISKGRNEEAREVFLWLRGHGDEQLDELEKMILAQSMASKTSVMDVNLSLGGKIKWYMKYLRHTYKKPEFYKPIIIMVFLYIMFQFAGINVISSYATDIIRQVVGPTDNANVIMVALDFERLFCNIFAVYLMKTMKRRTLLFSTGLICISSYVAKGVYVHLKQNDMMPIEGQWLPIALIAIYMFSLTVGISSIPFAVSGEIFPLEFRALGSGISILALSLNFFVALKCFPVLTKAIGLSNTYYLYASVVTLCMSVVWLMLPETKGRTLQEIEDTFRGRSAGDLRSREALRNQPKREVAMRRVSSVIMY